MIETLGDLIRQARVSRGWSLRQLARESGVHNAHLSQIENGSIAKPEVKRLWDISTALSLDFPRLLELAGHVSHDSSASRRSLAGAALHAVADLTPEEQAEVLDYMAEIRRRRAGTGDPDAPHLTPRPR